MLTLFETRPDKRIRNSFFVSMPLTAITEKLIRWIVESTVVTDDRLARVPQKKLIAAQSMRPFGTSSTIARVPDPFAINRPDRPFSKRFSRQSNVYAMQGHRARVPGPSGSPIPIWDIENNTLLPVTFSSHQVEPKWHHDALYRIFVETECPSDAGQ
jgi:hypothetical protein